jgi:exodeoxyribonuclease-3
MPITICTWNINSVRLREPIVLDLLKQEKPDVLCLQECKSPTELIPKENFAALGYNHMVARGQKGYNGVAILSKHLLKDTGHRNFCKKGDARHVSAQLPNGVTVQNFYVPAGGDVADREKNEKFGHKLDFLAEMRDWFRKEAPQKSVLVGDLNIAPR